MVRTPMPSRSATTAAACPAGAEPMRGWSLMLGAAAYNLLVAVPGLVLGATVNDRIVACDDMAAHPAGLSIVRRESWLTSDPARAAQANEWDRRHR